MPVRRRLTKRRNDPDALAQVWRGILESGFDFFHEARDLGIATNEAGQPDLAASREAWQRYGAHVLANRDPRLGPPWGLEQFGPPGINASAV